MNDEKPDGHYQDSYGNIPTKKFAKKQALEIAKMMFGPRARVYCEPWKRAPYLVGLKLAIGRIVLAAGPSYATIFEGLIKREEPCRT